MRSYLRLFSVGLGLLAVVTLFGGWSAGAGGMVAIGAQLVALALIRPAFGAPHPVFVRRWLAGMGIRAAAVIGLVVYAALHRSVIAPLPAALGCLGVLLPLLFTETRFLK
ncbi:MAG TPA: hypothetical protein VNX15_09870 [Gemmatimonadales bacterium]|nr:hypothetical protein [Gemmatimonadales bacterium]